VAAFKKYPGTVPAFWVNNRATQNSVGSQGNFERQELSENFAIEIDDVDHGHRPDFHHKDDGPMKTTTI
jgi:hypothetical protein